MAKENFFVPAEHLTPLPPREVKNAVPVKDPQAALIVRAMIRAYIPSLDASKKEVELSKVPSSRLRSSELFYPVSRDELNYLIKQFRRDPFVALSAMRINFINLVRNHQLAERDRQDLLSIYLADFLALVVQLDRAAFPASSTTQFFEGMPSYLPDGFSDLDYIPEVDSDKRDFEKIRVGKNEYYQKTRQEIYHFLWSLSENNHSPNSYLIMKTLAEDVMISTNRALPYDYKYFANRHGGKSVLIHTYRNAFEPVAVCRQHAIDTQLAFQALGLRAGVFKSYMNKGSHVNNILIGEASWYMADTTNPEIDPETFGIKPFIQRITPSTKLVETWKVPRQKIDQSGQVYEAIEEYHTRRPTYYRILDNEANPVE